MTNNPGKKDYWSAETYSAAASFVPQLTQTVLQYLDPQPQDRILDVGCGDGKFTGHFSSSVQEVFGVDASPSMIESAKKDFGGPNVQFKVVDCRVLEEHTDIVDGSWDKVISNAAFHWILRDPDTRLSTLKACYTALKPGGAFVFEMGGAGNVAEIHSALISAIVHQGVPIAKAREASPWFFPSEAWMRKALEDIGFEIEKLELRHRPTKTTTGEKGGLEGWIWFMCAQFLEVLDSDEKRKEVVREVCESLQSVVTRSEDGSQWIGYMRLRCLARKR